MVQATRYLIGTEQGVTLLVDRKAKKDDESQKTIKTVYGGGYNPTGAITAAHQAPIYSVQRNPLYSKFFLTTGDWSHRLYMEDVRQPLLVSRYDSAYITQSCWSTSRPSVFFTSGNDGVLSVWDLYHKHQEPVFMNKLSSSPLTSVRAHQGGRLLAVGAEDGSVNILKLSRGLVEQHRDEKQVLQHMFDREKERERMLVQTLMQKSKRDAAANKQQHQRSSSVAAAAVPLADDDSNSDAIRRAEEEFYTTIDTSSSSSSDAPAAGNDKVQDEQKVPASSSSAVSAA